MNSTIKDLARTTGLNISTVSRALNGQTGVSEQTRRKILSVARRMNYQRNTLASSLITKRTKTIGLILADIRNPFSAELARGVEDAAFGADYEVIFCNSDLDPDKELRYVRSLIEKRVDGMLINCVADGTFKLRQNIPVVFFNRPVRRRDISEVTADNYEGGLLAAQHLIELGHTRIAHLTGGRSHLNLGERCRGFIKALRAAGLKPVAILRGPHSYRGGYELCVQLLRRSGKRPTALFCGNDFMAIGAMRALREAQLNVPEDVAIVGFDDIEIAEMLATPLTTVYQPKYEMGQAAVRILLRHLAERDAFRPEHVVLPTRLVVRASTNARK